MRDGIWLNELMRAAQGATRSLPAMSKQTNPNDADDNGNISMSYLSIGVNRSPNCISWSTNGLIAYGGCNSIVLYRQQNEMHAGFAEASLNGHSARVNCVKWLTQYELLSGAADHNILNWHLQNNQWKVKSTLSGHTGAITCIATLHNANKLLLATAATDSTLNIWCRNNTDANFERIQTISCGHGIILAVALTTLQSSINKNNQNANYLMATTRENCKVNLYIGNYNDNKLEFQQVLSLSGHENWIRDLSFGHGDDTNILLASCAEDAYIRIWKIVSTNDPGDNAHKSDDEIKLKENIFHVKYGDSEENYVVTLDSVLSSHEDMVYSVNWYPVIEDAHRRLRLLSASMDKTMIIWEYDKNSEMWLDKVRVGTMGGNNLGFYGGIFSPDGKEILAQGYDGGLHVWKNTSVEDEQWKPQVTVTGHFAPVQDFDWEASQGSFLVTVSYDQTTRVHAPWIQQQKESSWHEIARPQIHGYDMQCVSLTECNQIVSGGEEKVIRVFNSPKLFSNTLSEISRVQLESLKISSVVTSTAALGASVPSLGLSNKAMYDDQENLTSSNEDFSDRFNMIPTAFKPVDLKEPPTELYLQQNTLWPEIQKLYYIFSFLL
ncbi:Elongator complex protein 2 [Trichoplax sp. H2]|nr:Elongator complex protein 2 [Trichoplax sp. H2]|eukprot:RDD42704.1 Elongator complex protein 2 [Trichoplax sp. H2]